MQAILSIFKKRKAYIYLALSLLLSILSIWFRISFASPFASTWDMVDFSLALERFDIFMMQPHFPGYPYFILAGMAVHQWIVEPAQALSVVNAILLPSTAIPVFWMLRNKVELGFAFIGSFAVQSFSYFWVMSTQPMSEASAVAVLIWFLWALHEAIRNPLNIKFSILASLIFSILMGIRLSYFPLGIGLLLLWWKRWRSMKMKSVLIFEITLFVSFNLIWIAALVASTGGFSHFIELSLSFVDGHFSDWGGSALTSEPSLIERFYRLVAMNFLWTGLFGESYLSGICFVLMVSILLRKRTLKGISEFDRWILVLFLAYFLWAWIGQNIEKPRHIIPLISLVMLMILRQGSQLTKGSPQSLIFKLTLVLFMMIQSINGIFMVKEIRTDIPASYQLEHYLNEQEEPFAVFTWEEERVLGYLDATYYYKKIYSYHLFQEEVTRLDQRRILITGRVLKGFENQGIDVTPYVTKVKAFHSNKMVDPIYSEIELFEWDPIVETP